MQFRTLIVSVFVAVAAAQTTTPATSASRTSASGGATSTGLVALVNDLPRCALSCLKSAADNIKCNPADFKCLCSNTQNLIQSIGPCALLACNSGDVSKLTSSATQICQQINGSPPAAEIASASRAIDSALATASGASGSATSSTVGAAAAPKRTDAPVFAVMGGAAAAWAAYAM